MEVGYTFRDQRDQTKCHIVNLFNDDGKDIITYKYWIKRRRRWIYKTQYMWSFLSEIKYNLLSTPSQPKDKDSTN